MSKGIELTNDLPIKEDGLQSTEAVVSEETLVTPPTPPADGGYGWVCLFACFCINAFTWGVIAVGISLDFRYVFVTVTDKSYTKSYGVYLAYYLANKIYPSASSIDFAIIGGLNFSMAMIVAPFVTIFARKSGTQIPMVTGATILAAGFVSASFAHEVWQLYLSQVFLSASVSALSQFSAWLSYRSGSTRNVAWLTVLAQQALALVA